MRTILCGERERQSSNALFALLFKFKCARIQLIVFSSFLNKLFVGAPLGDAAILQ